MSDTLRIVFSDGSVRTLSVSDVYVSRGTGCVDLVNKDTEQVIHIYQDEWSHVREMLDRAFGVGDKQ